MFIPKPTLRKKNIFLIIGIFAIFVVAFFHSDIREQYFSSRNIAPSIAIDGLSLGPLNDFRVEYTLSIFDEMEEKYIDTSCVTTIDPHNSALVIIDMWGHKFLDSMIIHCINPLITELSGLGMNIIYAPSQRAQNTNLLIIDNAVTFYSLDSMDEYLLDREIENLFYVGFDALYCVLDKPNGIYSYRLRDNDEDMNMFLFEEGVTSYTREMKEVAISLLKKNNVGIIRSDHAKYNETFLNATLTDPLVDAASQIDSGNNLVVIFKRDTVNKALIDFEASLNKNNIDFAVVYDETLHYKSQAISHVYEFIELLRRHEIKNICYCGYYLNNEILWSEFGIIPLYVKRRYYNIVDSPTAYVINDLSYIVPSPSIDPEMEKAVIINHYRGIRNILSTTLLAEFKRDVTGSE